MSHIGVTSNYKSVIRHLSLGYRLSGRPSCPADDLRITRRPIANGSQHTLLLKGSTSLISNASMATAAAIDQTASPYIDATLTLRGASGGPLSNLTFAVKDMYDIEGERTGFGNPTWRETHPAATSHAKVVQLLLDAGASVKGKTHMDELAYSLNGENAHYGTPRNPAAPGRVPGGSSSGSASAVASGDVDFALGSDTGGSVRVPASYTGILGIRPTHGRISLEGAPPLGASFDTCGWFARDAEILERVGKVLLPKASRKSFKFRRWLVAKDVFALADNGTQTAIFQAVKSARPKFDHLLGSMSEVDVATEAAGLGSLQDWWQVFRIIQAAEAWRDLGGWIQSEKPVFGPGTKERFEAAAKITNEEDASKKRVAITELVNKLLADDAVLVVPSAPGPAPVLNLDQETLGIFRGKLLSMTSVAGVCKLPQVSIPSGYAEDAPVGLSLIGPAGSDEDLLEVVKQLHPLFK